VIVGKDDKLTPPEYSKFIYGKIRNAHLAVIPDAGHFSNLENPDEFNRVITKFITEVTQGKGK
jgi:pimeloyl-ACP methyl ester carboxylesterase